MNNELNWLLSLLFLSQIDFKIGEIIKSYSINIIIDYYY